MYFEKRSSSRFYDHIHSCLKTRNFILALLVDNVLVQFCHGRLYREFQVGNIFICVLSYSLASSSSVSVTCITYFMCYIILVA